MEELRELISKVKETKMKDSFNKAYYFLMEERIKIIKKDLKDYVGLEEKDINKEKIIAEAKIIDDIAEKLNVSFRFGNNYDEIEKKLRFTILENIEEEFLRQKS